MPARPVPRTHPGSQKGWFRRGEPGPRTRPMYDERWTGHELQIKIPEPSPYPSQISRGWHSKSRWVAKSRWVWRQAGRTLREGHAVIHLDGDAGNCDLDNLEQVPRAVVALLNSATVGVAAPDTPDGHRTRVRFAQLRELMSRRATT